MSPALPCKAKRSPVYASCIQCPVPMSNFTRPVSPTPVPELIVIPEVVELLSETVRMSLA